MSNGNHEAWADPHPNRSGRLGRYQTENGVRTVTSRTFRRVALIFGTAKDAEIAAQRALIALLVAHPRPRERDTPGRRGQHRRRPVSKADLITALADGTGATKKDVEAILNNLPIALRSTVKAGNPFTLPGVGIFKAKQTAARTARNPATGATINVPARTKLAFKPAKTMADAVA